METQESHFNRNLLLILLGLFVLSIAAASYFMWTVEPGLRQWWVMLPNILILSIPIVLVLGSFYVLIRGRHERSALGQVSPRLARILRWAPRLAAILIIFFIGLFSLDVFEASASPLELLAGFLIHNIPAIVMLALLIFAWRRPVVGFAAFLIAAAAFTFFFVRDVYSLPNLLFFVLPIALVAFLFYADWRWLDPQQLGHPSK